MARLSGVRTWILGWMMVGGCSTPTAVGGLHRMAAPSIVPSCTESHGWLARVPRMTQDEVYGAGAGPTMEAALERAQGAAAQAISVDVRAEMSDKEVVWATRGDGANAERTETQLERAVDSFVVRRLEGCHTISSCDDGRELHTLVACERRSALEKQLAAAAETIGRSSKLAGASLLTVPGTDDLGYVTQLGEYAARVLRDGVSKVLAERTFPDGQEAKVASSSPWRPIELHEAARAANATHLLRVEHVGVGGSRLHISCYVQEVRNDHRVPGTDVAFDVDLEPAQAALLALRGPLLPQKDAQELANARGSYKVQLELSSTDLREGDAVGITIQVPREGYLYVYDIYEDGRAVLLHPGPYDQANHMAGGSTFTLPNAQWQAARANLLACPLGRQVITREYVKVVSTPVPLDPPASRHHQTNFTAFEPGPQGSLAALRARIEQLIREGVPVGVGDMPYFIRAGRAPHPACSGSGG